MADVQQQLEELKALLAGQPLVAIHEADVREQVQLKLGELQLQLVGIPANDRPIDLDTIQAALAALETPGQTYYIYDLLGVGETGPAPEQEATGGTGATASTNGGGTSTTTTSVSTGGGLSQEMKTILVSVVVAVTASVVTEMILNRIRHGGRRA